MLGTKMDDRMVCTSGADGPRAQDQLGSEFLAGFVSYNCRFSSGYELKQV
jgi:hypothetical protein